MLSAATSAVATAITVCQAGLMGWKPGITGAAFVPAVPETLTVRPTTTVLLATVPLWFVTTELVVVLTWVMTRWKPVCASVEPATWTPSRSSTGSRRWRRRQQ